MSVGGAALVSVWAAVVATGGGGGGGLRTVKVTLAVTPVRLWSLLARYTTSVCRPGRTRRYVMVGVTEGEYLPWTPSFAAWAPLAPD